MDDDSIPLSQIAAHQDSALAHDLDYGTPRQQLNGSGAKRGKILNDPVHRHIHLDAVSFAVIDSRQFQRLRDLKQLGVAHYVFPGATHSRLEHSFGVAHLAHDIGLKIYRLQREELDMEPSDLKLLRLAGLCHDLGHGPFSHSFEHFMRTRKASLCWSHEDMSCRILENIIDDKGVEDISQEELKKISALITGKRPEGMSSKKFLFDIVANHRNSIDVDKWDYLERDSYYCGVKVACDYNRLSEFCKVIDDEIVFRYSEYNNIYQMFHDRANLHQTIYQHKKVGAVEHMILDALVAADESLKFSEMVREVKSYVRLDDSLLRRIEDPYLFDKGYDETEIDASLQKSQAILKRLRYRDLYKYCCDFNVPPELIERKQVWKEPKPEDIVSYHSGDGLIQLDHNDIIVSTTRISFTRGPDNPMDRVNFFYDVYDTTKAKIQKEQVSNLIPSHFQDTSIRVYSRKSDKRYTAAVADAFQAYCQANFDSKATLNSPMCQRARVEVSSTIRRHREQGSDNVAANEDLASASKRLRFERHA